MTELSKTILDRYQIRKSTKQKSAFIKLLQTHFPSMKIQEGGLLKSRNLIVGDIESAKVLVTAHYDTCAQLPFPNFITPQKPLLAVLYSIIMIVPLIVAVFLVNLLLGLITDNYWAHYFASLISYFGLLILMLVGPANKHTANDNTSGVVLLCELIDALPDTLKDKVAFVFFDNEESGLVGSSYFRKCYKKQLNNKLLINFDCISDGNNMLLASSKTARKEFEPQLKDAFQSTKDIQILHEKLEKIYYPSDQAGFKNSVAVAALNKKPVIGYYMDKIHTKKDTVFEEGNIEYLRHSTMNFLESICR